MREEISYKLFNLVEQHPGLSQRELAKEMGISLGKANYCLKELVEKGWLKARKLKNSNNRIAYMYVLTPAGLCEKANVTAQFLNHKAQEFEKLKSEIETLRQDVSGHS